MKTHNRYYDPFSALESRIAMNENVCPKCGCISSKHVQFCKKCGYAFFSEPKAKDKSQTTLLEPHEKKSGNYCLISEDGTRISLKSTPFTIGKDKSCDLHLESNVVSRQHAKIVWCEDETELVDEQSTNGTFLNGDKLPSGGCVRLTKGDQIQFANVKYLFSLE